MKRRGGKQIQLSAGLQSLGHRLNKENKGALDRSRVASAWGVVAGEAVAKHTTGAHLRDGELVVYVDSPLWATELSALSEPYRLAINENLGQNLVRAVRFSVSRRVDQSREWDARERQNTDFYQQDKVEPIALSDAEREQVLASAASIPNDELREAVVRATIADLEWKKGISAAKSREEARGGS